MDEIMTCPFCGKTPKIITCSDSCCDKDDCDGCDDVTYSVCCSMAGGGCGATGGYRPTEEGAVSAWKERCTCVDAPSNNAMKKKLFENTLYYKEKYVEAKKKFGEWDTSVDIVHAKFTVLYSIIEECGLDAEFQEWKIKEWGEVNG